MNIKYSLPLLLALCATVALFVGCGSAPAEQEAESAAAPQAQAAATVVESAPQVQTEVAPAAETAPQARADVVPTVATVPQAKADVAPTVDTASQAQTVDVGYEVGMRAPEFGMSLLDGSKVTSAGLTDEGKPVFLYFHATF